MKVFNPASNGIMGQSPIPKRRPGRAGIVAGLTVLAAFPAAAQNLSSFEKKVTVRTLANGWTFIVCERPVAPVFSFSTRVDVGSAQEAPGNTGIAHMFEHMAFKGTDRIGTNDYPAEQKALEKVDRTYAAFDAARSRPRPDLKKVETLKRAWEDAQEEAGKFVVENEFGQIVEREGGVGVDAFTGVDTTGYSYSLPSNKTELWAYLESERFSRPVFREFYKEREVVKEERRLSTEDQPIERLLEQFIATAFSAHPYHHPLVGYMSDLDSFSREDAEKFYKTYYVPSNLVTAIVGDVKAAEIFPLVEKYFARIPRGDPPPLVRTVEPPQGAEKIVRVPAASQPIYVEGYHKESATSPDEPVYRAIADVLTSGRTSRLYRNLVRDRQSAVSVDSSSDYPGERFPNLFLILGIPAQGHANEEVRDAIRAELDRLKKEDITREELAMVKTRAKASLIEGLNSNQGLADDLADFQTTYGDWKELFRSVDRIDRVTQADIRRVAGRTFVDTNRTVATIEPSTEQRESERDAGR